MSLNVAAGISAVLGVPLASVPVGLTIHSTVQSFRPKTKLKKWSIRIEQISSVIASKGEVITPEEMRDFLRKLKLYKDARDLFRQRITDGTCTWYGKGKGLADDFSAYARDAWDIGLRLSTEASTRKAESYLPNNEQPSAVQVPATSSLPNEPEPSSSFQVLYSELEADNDLSVNLEDDTLAEDDSNDMAPEEVQAVYNLWRQIPEEQSPWASTASLREKLRLRGVISRRQH